MKLRAQRRSFQAPLLRVLTVIGLVIAALIGFSFTGLVPRTAAQAQATDALPYSAGFLVTGNYVVGGVDLLTNGEAGIIHFDEAHGNAVPAGADVIAAYLYWETVSSVPYSLADATFRGRNIPAAKAATLASLPGSGASCWGSGQGSATKLTMFRADVLAMLPKQFDSAGNWTGKYLVNDVDLGAANLHTVSMPQIGTGAVVTQTAGASLFLVYRQPSDPLRKIVVYDGAFAPAVGATMTQRIAGFYGAAPSASSRLTHIVGTGAQNDTERLLVNGAQVRTNPFPSPPSGSDRGWANVTVDGPFTPGTVDGAYGETVTTAVDPNASNDNASSCFSWAAVIFSTAVADHDSDGLPDALEDAPDGLKDPATPSFPDGQPLPHLNVMGASSAHKDLFIEVNAMQAPAQTKYGSVDAPYSSTVSQLTDPTGHNHLPKPEVLKMVGDAYARKGVTPHFDVGSIEAYHSRPGYACTSGDASCDADAYLVPSSVARGGEIIQERACASGSKCQFQDFPGTVGWRFGTQLYKDAPVADDGSELAGADVQNWGTGSHRRRFDRVRDDFFHYLLYAHARGKSKSSLPCLAGENGDVPSVYDRTADGQPVTATNPLDSCVKDNPQFHVPTSASGIADLPGSTALITLGLWDNFQGSTFMQASTTLHELGHNLNLWHGGAPAIWGNATAPTVVEPNCKPNYQSSMSYLFQAHGLVDADGELHIDYSSAAYPPIDEKASRTPWQAPASPYLAAWFAPASSPMAQALGASAAKRFCSGSKFGAVPPDARARVLSLTTSESIDWNGGSLDAASDGDVNFDGSFSAALNGNDDWSNLRLDQIGGARNVRVVSSSEGDFLDFGSGDFLDFGAGDFLDFGSGDFLDFGAGTYYVDFNSGDFLDFGSGDFLDFGSGDFLDFGSGVFLTDANGDGGASGDFLDFGAGFAAGDFLDFGSGDFLDFGSGDFLDFGAGDFLDFGSGDFLDFGAGDFLDFGAGSDGQELEFETVKAMGSTPPHGLKACVLGVDCGAGGTTPLHRTRLQWKAPTVGGVSEYLVYRLKGAAFTTAAQIVSVGSTSDMFFVDSEELPNGVQFTYFIKARFDDGGISGASNFATITARNDAPVAVNESYSTNQDSPLVIDAPGVLANDTDVDSASKRVNTATIGAPSHGTLALTADGKVVYTPASGYQGSDSFTYKANNGTWSRDAGVVMSADSNLATVSIIVNGRPVANNDAYSTNPGTALVVPAPGVLGNDTDPEGNALTAVLSASPTHAASFTLNSSGSFTYTPAAGYSGPDTFTYRASDASSSSSSVATVTITVVPAVVPPANHPPVCRNIEATVKTGGSVTLNKDCSDLDTGDTLNVTGITAASFGTSSLNQTTGAITYTVASPRVGIATFTYTVSDGKANTTANVSVRVIYGFTNVENLPPLGSKTFNRGGTVPLKWQWTNNAGVSLDSSAAQPAITAYACSTGGQLPGAYPVGQFGPANPGNGNSFGLPTAKNGFTWQFNWKLTYTVTANGQTKTYDLPAGTYVVSVKSVLTGQSDPGTVYSCADGMKVTGALITVQ